MIILVGLVFSILIVFCILAISIIVVAERITRINNIMDLLIEENRWSSNKNKNIIAKLFIDNNTKNGFIMEFFHTSSNNNRVEIEIAKFKKDYLSGVLILSSDTKQDKAKLYQKSGKVYLEANNEIEIFTKI